MLIATAASVNPMGQWSAPQFPTLATALLLLKYQVYTSVAKTSNKISAFVHLRSQSDYNNHHPIIATLRSGSCSTFHCLFEASALKDEMISL